MRCSHAASVPAAACCRLCSACTQLCASVQPAGCCNKQGAYITKPPLQVLRHARRRARHPRRNWHRPWSSHHLPGRGACSSPCTYCGIYILDNAFLRLLSLTATWQLWLLTLIGLVTRGHVRCHVGAQPNEQTSSGSCLQILQCASRVKSVVYSGTSGWTPQVGWAPDHC